MEHASCACLELPAQDLAHAEQARIDAWRCWGCAQVYRPRPASAEDMQAFHAEDYIDFLRNVSTENKVTACLGRCNAPHLVLDIVHECLTSLQPLLPAGAV